MNRVAIALGSNLGDRESNLAFAVQQLQQFLQDVRVSSFHETAPVGVMPQPDFLNAVVVGTTTQSARELLSMLMDVERRAGRQRPSAGAARTLDLDVIFHGDAVIEQPDLHVPHPRFRDRLFVLEPLHEVAPEWRDPVTSMTVAELLAIARKKHRKSNR